MNVQRRFSIDDLTYNYPVYAEGCLKIVNKERRLVPLRMNHSQRKVQHAINKLEAEGKPIRIVELKARQTGLSTDAEGRIFHRCHLRPNRVSLVVAHEEKSARKIFNMARIFYNNLPEQLRLPPRYFTKGLMEFENTNSSMQVAVAKNTGGRGFTAWDLHLSEAAYYQNLAEVLQSAGEAVPDDPDSIVIIESTPFGHNEFYDLWVKAKKGENDYIPIFIPWHEEPTYRRPVPDKGLGVLTDEELSLKEQYNVSDEQIQWRRWKIASPAFDGDEERFLQEHPTDDRTCFLASGRPAYDHRAIRHYVMMVPPERPSHLEPTPPLAEVTWNEQKRMAEVIATPHGRCRLYRPAFRRHRYMLGADLAEGIRGGDRLALAVLNRMTMDFEFFWYGFCPPEQLAVYADWIGRYYNEAEIIPEFNNHGYSFVMTLEERGYPNIWRRPDSFEKGTNAAPSERYGYVTSVRTRPWLFNGLRQYVIHRMGRIEDPECVGEMLTQVYEADKIIHLENHHDDVPTAAALALFGHRGSYDSPLAPLPLEEVRRISEVIEQRRATNQTVSLEALADIGIENLTATDLEELDDAAAATARAEYILGHGRSA